MTATYLSNIIIVDFLAVLISYLLGSISSAVLICRLLRLPDPRTQGSHNPGATNVLRIGGKKAAAATLVGDLLKGYIPVLIASSLSLSPTTIALVAFAAFIGHIFPVFFHFKGGKGVATALGCLLALSFPAGCYWIITWFTIALLFRYSSLAALIASLMAPIYIWFLTQELASTIAVLLMSMILFYRHRDNVKKLIAGIENKI